MSKWTESIAVGSERFIEATKNLLAIKTREWKIIDGDKSYDLHERAVPCGVKFIPFIPENSFLSLQNSYFWADSFGISKRWLGPTPVKQSILTDKEKKRRYDAY